jgi:hypothetical protein
VKRLVALCAGALVITAAAAATSGGTGLYGKAIISPASPVCQEGVPCSKPAKGFRLRFFRGTTHVADARTDAAGRFRIALAPGIYRIGAPTLRVVYPHIQPRTATVPRGRYAHVVLTIDLGIR